MTMQINPPYKVVDDDGKTWSSHLATLHGNDGAVEHLFDALRCGSVGARIFDGGGGDVTEAAVEPPLVGVYAAVCLAPVIAWLEQTYVSESIRDRARALARERIAKFAGKHGKDACREGLKSLGMESATKARALEILGEVE